MGRRNIGEPEKIGKVIQAEVRGWHEIRGGASLREENNYKSMDRAKLVHLCFFKCLWWNYCFRRILVTVLSLFTSSVCPRHSTDVQLSYKGCQPGEFPDINYKENLSSSSSQKLNHWKKGVSINSQAAEAISMVEVLFWRLTRSL